MNVALHVVLDMRAHSISVGPDDEASSAWLKAGGEKQVEAAIFNLQNARLNTLISERDMPVIAAELAHLLNWGAGSSPAAWSDSSIFKVRACRWVRDQLETEHLEDM